MYNFIHFEWKIWWRKFCSKIGNFLPKVGKLRMNSKNLRTESPTSKMVITTWKSVLELVFDRSLRNYVKMIIHWSVIFCKIIDTNQNTSYQILDVIEAQMKYKLPQRFPLNHLFQTLFEALRRLVLVSFDSDEIQAPDVIQTTWIFWG